MCSFIYACTNHSDADVKLWYERQQVIQVLNNVFKVYNLVKKFTQLRKLSHWFDLKQGWWGSHIGFSQTRISLKMRKKLS